MTVIRLTRSWTRDGRRVATFRWTGQDEGRLRPASQSRRDSSRLARGPRFSEQEGAELRTRRSGTRSGSGLVASAKAIHTGFAPSPRIRRPRRASTSTLDSMRSRLVTTASRFSKSSRGGRRMRWTSSSASALAGRRVAHTVLMRVVERRVRARAIDSSQGARRTRPGVRERIAYGTIKMAPSSTMQRTARGGRERNRPARARSDSPRRIRTRLLEGCLPGDGERGRRAGKATPARRAAGFENAVTRRLAEGFDPLLAALPEAIR